MKRSTCQKKVIWLLALVLLFVFCISGIVHENKDLQITEYTVESNRIPMEFDGFRIAQISDLHNAVFGENNTVLIEKLQSTKPDIIVITGDMIDSRRTDVEAALHVAEAAVGIAPTYFVSGNHEIRSPEAYARLKEGLTECGVKILDRECAELIRGDTTVYLIGVPDLSVYSGGFSVEEVTRNFPCSENYTILLQHHPEHFERYAQCADLVFSGHTHGGQICLPLIGGVFAPGQGFFPKYESGQYQYENTQMIVSRGIGNSLFPIRINNKPEITLTVLKTKK